MKTPGFEVKTGGTDWNLGKQEAQYIGVVKFECVKMQIQAMKTYDRNDIENWYVTLRSLYGFTAYYLKEPEEILDELDKIGKQIQAAPETRLIQLLEQVQREMFDKLDSRGLGIPTKRKPEPGKELLE